jgi:hypothetical protein
MLHEPGVSQFSVIDPTVDVIWIAVAPAKPCPVMVRPDPTVPQPAERANLGVENGPQELTVGGDDPELDAFVENTEELANITVAPEANINTASAITSIVLASRYVFRTPVWEKHLELSYKQSLHRKGFCGPSQ